MEAQKTPEHLWFEYITKLNDRFLKRRQSSGFTNWAICGLLVLLFYRILGEVPNIITDTNSFINFIILFTTIFNIIVSASTLILIQYASLFPNSDIRLAPSLYKIFTHLRLISFSLISFCVIILNLYIYFKISFSPNWPYLVIGVLFLIDSIGLIFSRLRLKLKTKIKYSELPLLTAYPVISSKEDRKKFIILSSLLFLIILIIAIIPLFTIINNHLIDKQLNIIKLTFDIIAFIFILTFLNLRVSSLLEGRFMENLERRIVLENLTSEEIKSIFIKEYLGETIRDWFNVIESKYRELHEAFQMSIKDAEKELEMIKDIDETYTLEIEGRRDKLCKNILNHLKNYNDYEEKIIKQIDYLVDQKAFIIDPDIFKYILPELKDRLEDVMSTHRSFCKNCKSILGQEMDNRCKIKSGK
jgi:hypothetical protein